MKIVIDLTNKCNLKCKHCGNANDNSFVNIETDFINILKNIPYTITKVDLLGGEPLLYSKLDDLLTYLEEISVEVSLISNGQFSDEMAKYLCKKMIRNISISIDGMREQNDQVRGKGSYDKAIKFLESLLEYKTNEKMDIGVNIVVNRLNCESIKLLIEKVLSQGVDYVRINRILEEGRACNSDLLIDDVQYLTVIEQICSEYCSNDLMEKIVFDFETPFLAYYLNIKYDMNYMIKKDYCDAAQHSIYINSIGEIYPCRSYQHKINLTNFINDISLCATKLIMNSEKEENDEYCISCFLLQYCFRCPLNKKKNPGMCKLLETKLLNYFDGFRKHRVKFLDNTFIVATDSELYLMDPSKEKNYRVKNGNAKLLEYIDGERTFEEISKNSNIDYYTLTDFLLDLSNRGGCEIYELKENYS